MNLPEILLDWRQHAESINRNRSSTWREMKALALEKTIERIGSKKFAENFFRTEQEFKFPESYLALGKLALQNRRYREAYRLFWRELRYGSDKRVAFDQILKIRLKQLWRKFSDD